MKRKKKNQGIVALKSHYGRMFTLPWLIGMILFFIIPLLEAVRYSFSEVAVVPGGIEKKFIGFANYKEILFSNPDYTKIVSSAITSFLYQLPIILLLSMVLAILLNQKFVGRTFFRALYFLPVIIASGPVLSVLFFSTSSDLSNLGTSEAISTSLISVDEIVADLGINGKAASYITTMISRIFDLIWNCGIQIVLFLAGLQSIPSTLYEASRVEGATKWEEFWFITFPMLSDVTLLVGVFTMVQLITNDRSRIITLLYNNINSAIYDTTSAMAWFYFLVSGGIMAFILFCYSYFAAKRWKA